jgi:hypothetical protein
MLLTRTLNRHGAPNHTLTWVDRATIVKYPARPCVATANVQAKLPNLLYIQHPPSAV